MQNCLDPEFEFKLVAKNDSEMAMIKVIVQNLDKIANCAQDLIDNSKRMKDNNEFDEMNKSLEAFFDYLMNPPSPADFNKAARLSTRAFNQLKKCIDSISNPQGKRLNLLLFCLTFV